MTERVTAEDMSEVAPHMYELVGAYLEGDRRRVGKICSRIERAGHTKAALAVADQFGQSLSRRVDARRIPVPAESVRQVEIRARLAAALPPEYELAVLTALNPVSDGRTEQVHSALGDGPVGDMLALHMVVAHIAEYGAHLYPREKWNSGGLGQLARMARASGTSAL